GALASLWVQQYGPADRNASGWAGVRRCDGSARRTRLRADRGLGYSAADGGGRCSGLMFVPSPSAAEVTTLASIEQRVLWLAVRIVDFANRERASGDGLKVGGHQASSASLVSIMTALYVSDLDASDRVSVKP